MSRHHHPAQAPLSLALLLFFSVQPAFANQSAPLVELSPTQNAAIAEAAGQELREQSEQAGRVLSQGAPNSRVVSGYNFTSLQFTQDQGDTSLSLALSFDLGTYRNSGPADVAGNRFKVGRTKIGVVGTVPIDKNGDASKLFQGDSLVSGSKIKLSVTHFSAKLGNGGEGWRLLGSAYVNCIKGQRTSWQVAHGHDDDAFFADLALELEQASRANGSGKTYDTLMREANDKGAAGVAVQACKPSSTNANGLMNSYDLMRKYGGEANATSYRRLFVDDNAKLHFWGLDASMGRDDRSFLDRTQFKLTSAPRTTWEVGAYYGIINSDLTMSARARLVYGQSYKDNDEAEICRTVSIPAGDECIKGPDGAPIRQRTGLASVEGRKVLTVNDKTQIAIAPQVTYRFEDKNVGVEVPIYLVPDEEGKLSGGIKAVYNSKGDEFAVGLFVGVPFSIFFDK